MDDEFDAGLGTTQGMWSMLDELLDEYEEKLPLSLSEVINMLAEGRAKVILNV